MMHLESVQEEDEDIPEELFLTFFDETGTMYRASSTSWEEIAETTGVYFPPGHYMTVLPISHEVH